MCYDCLSDREKLFVGAEFALLMILSISQYFGLSALNLMVTAGMLLLLTLSSWHGTIVLLYIAMPFFNLFTHRIGSVSLYYLMIFLFWWKYLVYHKMRILRRKIWVFLLLTVARAFCGDWKEILTWAALMVTLILTYDEDSFTGRIRPIVEYTTKSFLLASFVGYIMLTQGRSIYTRSYVYSPEGTTTRFAGLVGDSVFYAQFAVFFIALNLAIALYSPGDRKRAYSMCGLLGVFVLLTYAKTGIVLMACVLLPYGLFLMRQRRIKWKTVLAVMGVLLLIAVVLGLTAVYGADSAQNPMIRNYLTRLRVRDLWTGRREVASHYFSLIFQDWRTMFAAMPQSVYKTGISINGITWIRHTHNVYLETVCAFGWIGALMILGWVALRILGYLKSGKGNRIYNLMPLAVLVASGFVLHGHSEWQYYFLVALALAFMSDRVYSDFLPERKKKDDSGISGPGTAGMGKCKTQFKKTAKEWSDYR